MIVNLGAFSYADGDDPQVTKLMENRALQSQGREKTNVSSPEGKEGEERITARRSHWKEAWVSADKAATQNCTLQMSNWDCKEEFCSHIVL